MNKKLQKHLSPDGKPTVARLPAVIISGLVSGFFGAGGGAILIMLSRGRGEGQRDTFAFTSVLTAAFSVSSAVLYIKSGEIQIEGVRHLIIPALVGGGLGALLLDRINGKALTLIFGGISAVGGLIMLIS